MAVAEEYHSQDFEWESLRDDVEANPSLSYHLSSHLATTTTTSPSPEAVALPSPEVEEEASTKTVSEAEAWRSFHRRHAAGKFFKERRYLLKEFPELLNCGQSKKVLEVGCGSGSTVLPILRANHNITIYACDCSEHILEKAKEILSTAEGVLIKDRFHPFLLDISLESFPDWLLCQSCQSSSFGNTIRLLRDSNDQKMRKEYPVFMGENKCCVNGIDFVTLIFTLSAVPFNKMSSTIEQCVSVLKPGGLVLFRDYGLYDMTMLRFLPHQRVGFREYMRSDGTFSYFFSLDIARDLFCASGLIQLELEYCCVKSANRKNGKKMHRVWVHGKFQKPIMS